MESSFDKSFRQRLKHADLQVGPADWANMERLLDEQPHPPLPQSSVRYATLALLTSCLLLGGSCFFSPVNQSAGFSFPAVAFEKKQETQVRQSAENISTENTSDTAVSKNRQSFFAATYPMTEENTADIIENPSTIANFVPITEAAAAMAPQSVELSTEQHPELSHHSITNSSIQSFVRRRSPRIQWAVAAQTIWEAGLHNGQVSNRPSHRSGVLVQLSVGKYTEFSSGLLAGQTSISGRYTSPSSGQSVFYRNQLSECVIPLGVTFLPVQKGRWAMTLSAGFNQHVKLSEEIRVEDTEGQHTDWNNTFTPAPVQPNQAAKSDLPGVRDMVLGNAGRYYVSGWISSGMRVRLSSIIWLNAGFTSTLRPGLKGISGSIWGVGGQLGITARF
jgi:hypothetical protein